MREVHTICRPFLMLARQRTGVDLSSSVTAPEGGEAGTGTAICAQCGLSEEIASRLGGGEMDPSNEKWYCKPCWDQFYSVGMPPSTEGGEADCAQREGDRDDQDDEDMESCGVAPMAADADAMHQDVNGELTRDTDDEADAA